ncbi:MAG: CsgG/HfaB family protein [Candidatus Zhuqueibacterota bacterium]
MAPKRFSALTWGKARFVLSFFFFAALLNFGCAGIPELTRFRTDTIVRGPEFSPYSGLKKTIAVFDFENVSEHGSEKIGSAVADMLVTQLVRSDRFIVVERSRLEQILQEQAIGQSGVITETTAPAIGKLLGAETLIIGKILEANQETGAHKFDNEKNKWGLALKATIANTRIHYKLINSSSGEILQADDVTTTEIKPGFGFETKEIDFTNMFEFDQTILGTAIRKAVNEISIGIVAHVGKIDWNGKVVQALADTLVYFTPGIGAGVQAGQLFDVYEPIVSQTDSVDIATDAALNIAKVKARIRVTGFIGDKVSRAKVLLGKRIERGDIVKFFSNSTDTLSK